MPLRSNSLTKLLKVFSFRVEPFGKDRISNSIDSGESLFEIENKNTTAMNFE